MTQENNGEKTAKSSRNVEIISPAPAVRSYKDRLYVSDLYSGMVQGKNLYGTKKVGLPTPHFLIFYNGVKERPDREILKLSDLFQIEEEEYSLELTAVMLNINPGHNRELLDSCRRLKDYSEYTNRVRRYAGSGSLEQAVERAITECIQEGILADFLEKYRAEVKSVSIYEYNEERHMMQVKEEGREEGRKEGREEGIRMGGRAERERMSRLLLALKEAGRMGEIEDASDPAYLEKLYREFGLLGKDEELSEE